MAHCAIQNHLVHSSIQKSMGRTPRAVSALHGISRCSQLALTHTLPSRRLESLPPNTRLTETNNSTPLAHHRAYLYISHPPFPMTQNQTQFSGKRPPHAIKPLRYSIPHHKHRRAAKTDICLPRQQKTAKKTCTLRIASV